MKKWFLGILILVLLCTVAFTAYASNEPALPEICEHCGVAVTWTPWSAQDVRDTSKLSTGHYYVAMEEDSYDSVVKQVGEGQQVCLYLNGKTLKGTTRGAIVKNGGILNIMGDGTLTGRGTTAGVDGACINVEAGGTLNQYGGTLTYVEYMQRHAVNGGVVYVAGTYNLYDGVVENGITKQYHGGNVYVAANGEFNMYGGTVRNGAAEYAGGNVFVYATATMRMFGGVISGGTAKVAGNSLYNRGTLYLSGDAACNSIFSNADTAKGGPALGDMINLAGSFTGDVTLEFASPKANMDVGNATEGTLDGVIRVLNAMLTGQVKDGDILLVASGYCEHCKRTVTWEKLEADAAALYDGHYYAEADITDFAPKNIYIDNTVCVNLNGKTVKSKERCFNVYPGGVLNLMGGNVIGGGSTEKTPIGGAISIVEEGILNFYSGSLAYEVSSDSNVKAPSNGGVLNVGGTFNMYGGTVKGGVATNAGGTIFVMTTGVLNISGGTVEMGKSGTNGSSSCIYNRGTVILSGDPMLAQLLQKPNVADGGPALGDMMILRDTFSGQVDLRFTGPAVGMDAGNTENADFSNATIKVNGVKTWNLAVAANDLILVKTESVLVCGAGGTVTGYADFAAAMEAATMDDRIVLLSDLTEQVALTKDITLDLNGHTTPGFSGNKTVYLADSQTDDYTVADGNYGKLLPGDCKLLPAEGYLLIAESGAYSAHKLTFNITAVSLRQRNAGLYFTAEFAGDELVADNIRSFGVALNAAETPDADNMQTTSLYTAYQAATWRSGESLTATGTILSGILDTENDVQTNDQHAETTVYGNAYVLTSAGYQFGSVITVDLRSILEQTDEGWASLNSVQKKNTISMYDTYTEVMENWSLANLKTEKEETARYASVEKTASESDIALLDSHYSQLNAYHGELHDHASTGGRSDGKQSLEVWTAYMNHLDMDFAAIVDHKQVRHMYLDEWKNGMFIGGTEAATTVKELGMSMHYNMMFTDPEALIRVLEAFPVFNYTGGDPLTAEFPYYPSFNRATLVELISAIRENGGMFTQVHPTSPSYIQSDDPLDYWFADWTGFEVVTTYHSTRDGNRTAKNYEVWVKLLDLGKKVWATSGNDEHNMPTDKALSTVYATAPNATAYFDNVRQGNFAVGPVGIQMCVGATPMGCEGSFEGQRVVLRVGDFHRSVYDPDHTYRVDLITNEGIVFSQEISCDEISYFAVNAENVAYYRVEVWDTTINSRLGIGNPIWNIQ